VITILSSTFVVSFKNKEMRNTILYIVVICLFSSCGETKNKKPLSVINKDSLNVIAHKKDSLKNENDNHNSPFKRYMMKSDPKINIHDSMEVYDYSDKWDFDGDGKTDALYFLGSDGAHVYYSLRIILSSDKKVRDFPYLSIDCPYDFGNIDSLRKANFFPPPVFPQFVVGDFYNSHLGDDNLNDKIYIHLDLSTFSIEKSELKKQGVTSSYILLRYKKGKFIIKNFFDYYW